MQLNFLITENRHREIVDPNCDGVQTESLDALLALAIQCVSSTPEERPTMHRVVQLLESEVMTPCPSDFYDSEWEHGHEWFPLQAVSISLTFERWRGVSCSFFQKRSVGVEVEDAPSGLFTASFLVWVRLLASWLSEVHGAKGCLFTFYIFFFKYGMILPCMSPKLRCIW